MINCSSGDRRGAEAGEISLTLCYTVYERKTQRLQGSAAQCKEHELSAPPFPQDKILFKHNFAGSVGVFKKKIKAISMSVCGLCEMLLLCICATSESCSGLSRVLTPPRASRCYFKFTPVEQIFLCYDKCHFDSLSPIYSKPPFRCFLYVFSLACQ